MDHNTFRQHTGAPTHLYLLHATVSHYIKNTWAPQRIEPPQHELVRLLYYMGNGGHLVKWLHTGIRAHAAINLDAMRTKWAEDTDTQITDKAWQSILEHPKRVSCNTKLKFLQTMILHRSYLTPHKIHRMFPDAHHHCPHCKSEHADFIYMFWSCSCLQDYWKGIHNTLAAVTHLLIQDNALACLMGLRKRTTTQKTQLRFQDLSLILAIRCLTIQWKSPRCPSLTSWQTEVFQWGKSRKCSTAEGRRKRTA